RFRRHRTPIGTAIAICTSGQVPACVAWYGSRNTEGIMSRHKNKLETAPPVSGEGNTTQPAALIPAMRQRGCGIYQARPEGAGDALSDWLAAEREVGGSGWVHRNSPTMPCCAIARAGSTPATECCVPPPREYRDSLEMVDPADALVLA